MFFLLKTEQIRYDFFLWLRFYPGILLIQTHFKLKGGKKTVLLLLIDECLAMKIVDFLIVIRDCRFSIIVKLLSDVVALSDGMPTLERFMYVSELKAPTLQMCFLLEVL